MNEQSVVVAVVVVADVVVDVVAAVQFRSCGCIQRLEAYMVTDFVELNAQNK